MKSYYGGMDAKSKQDKLLVLLGEGGHTKEMLILVDLLGPHYQYEYVITQQDLLSESKVRRPGPIHRVTRPRSKNDNVFTAVVKLVKCGIQALGILQRSRPNVLVTSGPALAVPFALWARLMGVNVIFVETGSRVRQLSLTGRLMRRLASLFFVQWPQLHERFPDTIYAGRFC